MVLLDKSEVQSISGSNLFLKFIFTLNLLKMASIQGVFLSGVGFSTEQIALEL
jgi:hypothetical protein